jgi:hypothetical protein
VAAATVDVNSTEWVPLSEAAARLGISSSWVRALAEDGSIEIQPAKPSSSEIPVRRSRPYI